MNDIWLVRHGATEWSKTGRHTGRSDVPLLPEGERVAMALRPVLAKPAFALVLTSPLTRARETARLAGFEDAEIEPDLREWDYGDYEGLTTREIREGVPDWLVWTSPIPNGESIGSLEERARRVLSRCDAAPGAVLLFGHGHLLRVLTAVAFGFAGSDGRRFTLDAGAYSVIGHEHEYRSLRRWNTSP